MGVALLIWHHCLCVSALSYLVYRARFDVAPVHSPPCCSMGSHNIRNWICCQVVVSTQKKLSPKQRSAFIPTLHVRFPGTNVFTWMWTNLVPSKLLHSTSVLGVFPRVTTAEYPLRHSSPATKNWLAFPLVIFSFPIVSPKKSSVSGQVTWSTPFADLLMNYPKSRIFP